MFRLLTLIAFIIAASARAWLHFSTPMVQGMNGAYYLVQARSLIEKLSLAIPDLPLTFTLHALLAKTIHLVTSLSLNESVLLAVKMADSMLPALLVIPVMLLGRRWSREGQTIDLVIAAVAGVLIAAGAPALLMVGDFEKNSLGLALLCTLAWALHRWAAEPGTKRMLTAVGVLGLIGLTHIGVFGTTLVFVCGTLGALTVAHGREGFVRVGRILLIAVPVVALAAGIVFWKFDPARVQKLLHAFSEPSDYLANQGGPAGMRGGPGPMPGGNRPGGMMMGPSLFPMPPGVDASWMRWAPTAAFFAATLIPLALVWWRRRTIGVQNIAVITGAALTVIAITGPWVQGDKVMRFQLNAVPLAVLCLLFALLQIPRAWLRGGPALALLIAALIPSWMKLSTGARPIISEESHRELKELALCVEDPANTLIVAHHGLEWWTAWTLHTHIAQAQALKPEDWKKYKYVWFIEDKGGMRGPFGGGGPGGMARMGPPMGNRPERRDGFPGMPPGGGGGPGGRPGMGGGMGGPTIPDDAEVLHEGRSFKLAWVKSPPTYLTRTEPNALSVFSDTPFEQMQ